MKINFFNEIKKILLSINIIALAWAHALYGMIWKHCMNSFCSPLSKDGPFSVISSKMEFNFLTLFYLFKYTHLGKWPSPIFKTTQNPRINQNHQKIIHSHVWVIVIEPNSLGELTQDLISRLIRAKKKLREKSIRSNLIKNSNWFVTRSISIKPNKKYVRIFYVYIKNVVT